MKIIDSTSFVAGRISANVPYRLGHRRALRSVLLCHRKSYFCCTSQSGQCPKSAGTLRDLNANEFQVLSIVAFYELCQIHQDMKEEETSSYNNFEICQCCDYLNNSGTLKTWLGLFY